MVSGTPVVHLVTTGGSIDKTYSLEASDFLVGAPAAAEVARRAGVTAEVRVTEVARKDSLELTDADRAAVRAAVEASAARAVVITHGTDTMAQTARALVGIPGKTVVLTGAMRPAAFRDTDAEFNLGFAFAAAQLLPDGVYLAMNGRVFDPAQVRKDMERGAFVEGAAGREG